MRLPPAIPLTAVAASLLLLCSCSGDNEPAAPGPGNPVPVSDSGIPTGLPDVASLDAPAESPNETTFRTTSATVEASFPGGNVYRKSDNALSGPLSLTAFSGPGTMEYGIYRIETGMFTPTEIRVEASFVSGPIYYGLADFETGRWRIYGPFNSGFTYSVPLNDPIRSQFNATFLAVIAYDRGEIIADYIHVAFEKPQFSTVELENIGTSGQHSAYRHRLTGRAMLGVIDQNDGRLEFWSANADYPTGIDDWDSHVVFTEGADNLQACDLAGMAYNPGIVFSTSGAVRYAAANNSLPGSGSDWDLTTIVNSPMNGWPVLMQSSLDSGAVPLVAWGESDADNDQIWFGYADVTQPDQDAQWNRHFLEFIGLNYAGLCSFAMVDNKPWVLYYHPDTPTEYYTLAQSSEDIPGNSFKWSKESFELSYGAQPYDPYPGHSYPMANNGSHADVLCKFEPAGATVPEYAIASIRNGGMRTLPLGIEQADNNIHHDFDFKYVTDEASGMFYPYFAAVTPNEQLPGRNDLAIGYGFAYDATYTAFGAQEAFYIARYLLPDNPVDNVQVLVLDGKPLVFYNEIDAGQSRMTMLYQTN